MAEQLTMKGDDHYRGMITPQEIQTEAGTQKTLPCGAIDLEVAQIELLLDVRKLLMGLCMQAGIIQPNNGSGLYVPRG